MLLVVVVRWDFCWFWGALFLLLLVVMRVRIVVCIVAVVVYNGSESLVVHFCFDDVVCVVAVCGLRLDFVYALCCCYVVCGLDFVLLRRETGERETKIQSCRREFEDSKKLLFTGSLFSCF